MNTIEMPRRDRKLRLDERIVEGLEAHAKEQDTSFNALCESILFMYAKSVGRLPLDAEPLGETRGGKRPGSGKPKKTESSDN
ncbi:hypothetical protein IQ266_25120 [filamentous cyanobacterium LEGE 11480]|uniref:Uncharacterized protein n=1 Tax=Romeriopsis navalis LEGE 11480 TaxID=2777977 RepID=A0A928VV06_9CYAN|nr:hypothetical protein [Romeriopsis navalis]MBE9033022.1 hypothetical protein [Romeriopsis navalis LEGE 11480]